MRSGKGKILIVEDEAIVRESIRDWLMDEGYTVEGTETGEQALALIAKEDFDIIVLDLRLQGIDGLQVFEQAKKLKPQTKGIMITAYPSVETRDRARRLGLLDYLPKPFRMEELEKVIRSTLQEMVEKKLPEEQAWVEFGAVTFQTCTRNYECISCGFAQDIRERYGNKVVISEDEVIALRERPANQRVCPYREWLGAYSEAEAGS